MPYRKPQQPTLRGVTTAAMLAAANGLTPPTRARKSLDIPTNGIRSPSNDVCAVTTSLTLPESTCRQGSMPQFISVTPTPPNRYGPGSSTIARRPSTNTPITSTVPLNPDKGQAKLSTGTAGPGWRDYVYDVGADAVHVIVGNVRGAVVQHVLGAAPGVLRRARRELNAAVRGG